MIKGICKEAVIVKLGGRTVDEAIFILKKGSARSDRKAILDEANMIIKEKTNLMNEQRLKKKRSFLKILNDEDC